VHGVTSWLPIYTAFRNEGATVVSLSGAPLARSARPAADTAIGRLMDSLGAALEPVYGFPLALAFKMPR
jgi:lysylphosphatidylglycerol synthetase-like protein (DUF2156 family)